MVAVAALAVVTAAAALEVRITPCADNGFRVQVFEDAHLPPAVVTSWRKLNQTLKAEGLSELPGAFVEECAANSAATRALSDSAPSATNGNLQVTLTDGELTMKRVDTGSIYATATATISAPLPLIATCTAGAFAKGADLRVANVTLAAAAAWCAANATCVGFTTRADSAHEPCDGEGLVEAQEGAAVHEVYFKTAAAVESGDDAWRRWRKPMDGFMRAGLRVSPGDATERLYGLGQTGWTKSGGCPSEGPQTVVPLARNGQTVELLQTKFSVGIPVAFSSAGYGLLFHMPGCARARRPVARARRARPPRRASACARGTNRAARLPACLPACLPA